MDLRSGPGWFEVPPPPDLIDREWSALLETAAAALRGHLTGSGPPPFATPEKRLQRCAGVFVSLYHQGALCGCIGLVETRTPLWKATREMAIASATRDPRFQPLEAGQLAGLRIEISVLGPLVAPLRRQQGEQSGLLLPQVGEKYGWDALRFLGETSLKAQLAVEAWRHGETDLKLFRAARIEGEVG